MSRFYFFTEIDSLANQPPNDVFGSVIGFTDTQFRVTSIHRAAASAVCNAYAVCNGLILAQDAGTNLVNLILKPTEQPPFAFPKIKFFIYRGIKKSTLVTSDDIAPSTNNDLTKSIWESQQAKNASAGTSDNAPAKALGIDITSNGSIDDVFYRDNVSFQLQPVKPGWNLGEFDPAQFGFEIMVEAIGFDPELPLVRTAANIINVAALPASPTQAQEFEYWHDKEAILNYIDPCAFFGGFYFHSLKVKHQDGSSSPKRKNEVYDDVLKGAHLTGASDGVFLNRNKTYLDIRNEYNHSINYFKNYGTYTETNISCAFDAGDPLTARNYYASTWPLMVIDNSDLFPGNTAARKNTIRISLPDGAGDNPLPTLYISTGQLDNLFPREPKDKAKLIDLNVSGGFTDEVGLAIPNRDDLSSTTAISTYIKLKYFKRFDPTATTPPVSSGTVIRAGSFLDNIFAPFDMKIPFSGPARIISVMYDAEVFVDMSRTGGYDYVGDVGILDDGTDYTFILLPKIIRRRKDRKAGVASLCGEKYSSSEDVWSLIASKIGDKAAQRTALQLAGSSISVQYVKIADLDDDQPVPYDEPFFGVRILTCRKSQLLGINKSGFMSKGPIYLGAHNLARYADELGQEYWNFNLSLKGLGLSGNTLGFKEVVSNISMYVAGNLSQGDDIQVATEETTVLASALPLVPPVPPIKHIFVLMLENRSFDHMLGFSGITGTDAITGQPTTVIGATAANENPHGFQMISAQTPADFQIVEVDQGPPHEFLDVLRQLCATNDVNYNLNTGVYPTPNNLGFIYSYASGNLESEGDGPSLSPQKIMKCYAPAQVPVLTTLAQKYAVCDNWYSSLPGPTWPNRFFVHAATSGGLAQSPSTLAVLGTAGPLPVDGFDFEHGNIFERLSRRNMSWRVYEDGNPQVTSLEGMNEFTLLRHYRTMAGFEAEVMNQNFAVTYSFIEPDHGWPLPGNDVQFLDGTSQHPRDDVRPGEMLIKRVYETIRNSPHWNNSVLVITYDEHGGFYDHVLPPTESHPPGDQKRYHTENKFNFRRLGVRVPAVIVSPLIPEGTIDHTRYDHTSILATLERMFRLAPLTERDKHANDFRHLFSLTIPRVSNADAPRALPPPPAAFPNAAGPSTYRADPYVIAPIILPPPGGIPIKDPLYRPFKKIKETDLKLVLAADPTLKLPTKLIGDRSADLLAWLHVAFRRRLAVWPIDNLPARKKVLKEYCAVQTVAEAGQFIALSEKEIDDFRILHPLDLDLLG